MHDVIRNLGQDVELCEHLRTHLLMHLGVLLTSWA